MSLGGFEWGDVKGHVMRTMMSEEDRVQSVVFLKKEKQYWKGRHGRHSLYNIDVEEESLNGDGVSELPHVLEGGDLLFVKLRAGARVKVYCRGEANVREVVGVGELYLCGNTWHVGQVAESVELYVNGRRYHRNGNGRT